ncbi:hypothetical protein OPIT5_29225 [Opitutaceae bacterium TAV5]|nr:hypothetical protein OPIT5_29225 [Opitutaceae bacterium TAV5]
MANGAADIAADDPSLYNQDATDSSSNQKGVPVPWWTGLDWRPLTWIVPDTIDATGKPGLTGTTIKKKKHGVSIKYGKKYRANVAGIAGLGVIDSIHAIEINKAIVWPASGVPDEHGLRRDDGAAHTAGNPDSPYWRATIALRQDAINSQFRLYWGRADQPADNTVLAKWAALGYEHPAYRGQVLCCMENWYFGRNCTNVPNTRILVRRSPQPEVGNFPTTWNPRGESLPAAILELLTNKIYGAGIPPEHFTPAQWEALSAAVMADIGHHSPQLLRAEPVTDTMKKLLSYYDGYLTIRGSTITPGRYPHDAVKVAPRASITLYDLTDKPRLSLTPAAQAVNTVTVTCRDRAAKLVESTVTARDTSAIAARDGGEIAATLDMPAITDLVMAEQYAARAAATATSAQRHLDHRTPARPRHPHLRRPGPPRTQRRLHLSPARPLRKILPHHLPHRHPRRQDLADPRSRARLLRRTSADPASRAASRLRAKNP